jgi:hypothetical protein
MKKSNSTNFSKRNTDMGYNKRMKLEPVKILPVGQFQQSILNAKTMRSKLAVCFKKLSEQGAFSDAPPELHDFRAEMAEFLPEELR